MGKWRDAAENIKLEIESQATSASIGNSGRLLLKSCPFDRPKIVQNGVDATMVAK